MPTTLTLYPLVTGDDCYKSTVGSIFVNNSYLVFGRDRGTTPNKEYCTYIRFPNVAIPKCVEIQSAVITLDASHIGQYEICNLAVYAHNVGSSVAPTSLAEFDALSLTAGVDWLAVPTLVENQVYNTPSLVTPIQSVVNGVNWNSGNALGIVIAENGSVTGNPHTLRYAKSVDWVAAGKPKLVITFRQTVWAEPFILSSEMSAHSVSKPDTLGYAYEEGNTGIETDVSVQSRCLAGQNIVRLKQPKYIFYDMNTHGKDVTVTVEIDGKEQAETFTVNTDSRKRGRIVDIPILWAGYKFSVKLSADNLIDNDLEIYSPFGIAYTPYGV